MKVISVAGARPEFIQAAPISRALRPEHHEILVHTGQHYDYLMSAVFFEQLGLPVPDYNLEVGSGPHGWQTGQMLVRLEQIILAERPDWVIVRGDTNSTLAGALAAAKLGAPLAHVEAGLRSFDRAMPEEINRLVTDRMADLLFCPTNAAIRNLSAEGIHRGVHRVGDVNYDGLLYNLGLAERHTTILADLDLASRRYLMATVHRAGNTGARERLAGILAALGQVDERVIFPVHPRTRKQIAAFGLAAPANVTLLEPLSYYDSLIMQRHARLLLTDSGGMQKEAYCLGTPCVTLREQTEWIETVEAGWNTLAGADTAAIVQAVRRFSPPATHPPLYGDGNAAQQIVALLAAACDRQA